MTLLSRRSIPIQRGIPTEAQIQSIPLAYPGVYELSEGRRTRPEPSCMGSTRMVSVGIER